MIAPMILVALMQMLPTLFMKIIITVPAIRIIGLMLSIDDNIYNDYTLDAKDISCNES